MAFSKSSSRGSSPEAIGAITDYAGRRRAADGTPGLALALTDGAETLDVICLGHADLGAGIAVSPHHAFQIGSVSKTFAAIVALQLADEGSLDLHAPLQRYLPWFDVRTEFEPITMHDVLTHTAGLISGSLGFVDARAEVWALRDTETAWAPGSAYHYSNAGYDAAGLVISAVAGQPFRDVLRDRVLEPLGMRSSETAITPDVRPRLATPYTPFFTDRPFRPGHRLGPATWFEDDRPDGSICSVPEDMAVFVRMLLARGTTPGGERLISDEGFARMTSPPVRDERGGYGYGIVVEDADGTLLLGHGGDMVGYNAHLLADVELGIGAVVMANGPVERAAITRYALAVMAADRAGSALPSAPAIDDPFHVERPHRYAGSFSDGRHRIDVNVDDGGSGLALDHDGDRTRLERVASEPDTFFVPRPGLDRALLEFEVVGERSVRVLHGGRRYELDVAPSPDGVLTDDDPDDDREHLRSFEGLYRSTSPWQPTVRFATRGDHLVMVDPVEGIPQVLMAEGEDSFRVAGTPPPPGVIRFSRFIDGTATCAQIECLPYYRCFDPPSPWNDEGA